MLVLLAAWNAALRPSSELPITPFYVLAPFVCFALLASCPWFRHWLKWLLLLAVYGLAVGSINGVPMGMQLAQLLKYGQLLTLFGLLRWIQLSHPIGHLRLRGLVWKLVWMVFAVASVQLFSGFEFPALVNEESSLWLNTFFYTPNDAALFLGGALCLLLASNASLVTKALVLTLISAFNLRNDAKAVLFATALMLLMLLLLKLCQWWKLRPLVGLIALGVIVPIAVWQLADTVFGIDGSEFDFFQLFLDPIERIINLEPYNLGGSIFDRTDALIHSLSALKSMHWLGLGPAGSVHTLSLPNFELLTAKSLHNALAELLVELGPAALLLALAVSGPVWRALWERTACTGSSGRLLLVAAAPMLSVSQSSGFISNYAFWLTAYVLWFAPSFWQTERQAVKANRTATVASTKGLVPA